MRKQRTRSQGLSLARAYRSSGLTCREFSKQEGVTECSIQYWCKQLNRHGVVISDVQEAKFVEVKASSQDKVQAAKVTVGVGAAEISFRTLPEASWMSEFVVTVNRYS
jgi:transposase